MDVAKMDGNRYPLPSFLRSLAYLELPPTALDICSPQSKHDTSFKLITARTAWRRNWCPG
jgi:hypothetical protein